MSSDFLFENQYLKDVSLLCQTGRDLAHFDIVVSFSVRHQYLEKKNMLLYSNMTIVELEIILHY